jgi:hypothetical protein
MQYSSLPERVKIRARDGVVSGNSESVCTAPDTTNTRKGKQLSAKNKKTVLVRAANITVVLSNATERMEADEEVTGTAA